MTFSPFAHFHTTSHFFVFLHLVNKLIHHAAPRTDAHCRRDPEYGNRSQRFHALERVAQGDAVLCARHHAPPTSGIWASFDTTHRAYCSTLPFKSSNYRGIEAWVANENPSQAPSTAVNAVIMGRKTWDSIPTKFRPLKDRLNIVISRSAPATPPAADADPRAEPVKVNSLEAALQYAGARADVARVFIMGGAQIYDAALKLPEARRVLLTSIEREFDCDAFFPLRLGDGGMTNWIKRPRAALEEWTGQEVVEGGQEEAGTQYEFQMWEKTG